MPDDQISTDRPTLDTPSLTLTDELTVSSVTVRDSERLRTPEVVDSDSLAFEHQRIIRQRLASLYSDRAVPTISRTHAKLKRVLDVALTLPALVVLSPILLLTAIAIRLDSPGPALFRQYRVGQHGRMFRMLKFRTMVNGSGVVSGAVHKQRGDQRITRLGRILRQTSIDELPQLINVVRGEMSLVGPRPEIPVVMVERYQPWQYQRLSVPQGITGWWQVTGRGSKLMWQHTEDDIEYIKRATIWLDIKILFRTFHAVIRRDGAF